jgi:hypothetical protein
MAANGYNSGPTSGTATPDTFAQLNEASSLLGSDQDTARPDSDLNRALDSDFATVVDYGGTGTSSSRAAGECANGGRMRGSDTLS